MTDLVVSTLILAAYTIGCVAVWLRLRQLDKRRAQRATLRRIRRYRIEQQRRSLPTNVVQLDPYSRKVS